MKRTARCITLAFLVCSMLAPAVVAADLQTAKVYRDYPGYFTPPTCVNPALAGEQSTATGNQPGNWNRPYAWTVTPMAGYHIFDGGLDIDNNVSVGLAIGYNLTNRWTMEADLRYTPTQSDFPGGGNGDINVWTIGGGMLYHLMPELRVNPYLAFGLGGMIYDIDDASSNDEDYMGYWGGGIKYALNSMIAIRVDLRHIIDYRSDSDFDGQDGPNWRHHLSSMVGLTYQFGQ